MAEAQQAVVYDVLKTHLRFAGERHTGSYGVEIETETLRKYEYPELKYWRCTKDGSLRDWGVEYILKAPADIKELHKALAEFDLCEKKYKFNKGSISTSVHVHINMLNETYLTLANFLTAYALVENLLIIYSGPDRLSNLFCLPMRDAEGAVDHIVKMLQAIGRNNFKASSLHPDHVKYGALNCAPLNKLGTVEVRCFRGETDAKVIEKWIAILDKLKKYAKSEGLTPVKICEHFMKRGENIVVDIFGEFAKELMVPEKTKALLRENIWYAAKISNSSKDWSKFGLVKVKKVYKEKLKGELDALTLDQFPEAGGYNNLEYAHRLVVMERYLRANPNVRIVEAEEDI